MSLRYRERRRLGRIGQALRASDPQLAAMLILFGQLSAGERMPGREQRRAFLTRARCAVLFAVSLVADLIARLAGRCSRRLRRAAGHRAEQAAA